MKVGRPVDNEGNLIVGNQVVRWLKDRIMIDFVSTKQKDYKDEFELVPCTLDDLKAGPFGFVRVGELSVDVGILHGDKLFFTSDPNQMHWDQWNLKESIKEISSFYKLIPVNLQV